MGWVGSIKPSTLYSDLSWSNRCAILSEIFSPVPIDPHYQWHSDYPISPRPTCATLGIDLWRQCTQQSKSRNRHRLVWCPSGRFSRSKTDGQADPPDHRRGSMQRRSWHVVTRQAEYGQEFPVRRPAYQGDT